ncbi:sugar kinase [Spelaeicoccus albus]
MPRLISIGETMALVTPATTMPLAAAVDFHLDAGGAESNVAAHAAQLGVPSAWVSALGDDALGQRIRSTLERRGVDVRWVAIDPDAPTGVYFKDPGHGVLYYRRGSAASKMSPAGIADIRLEDADVVYISGITPALSASCRALTDSVFERAAAAGTTLSFDINHRPALWKNGDAGTTLLEFARRADIVFVGLDEAAALWECVTPDDVHALLPEPGHLIVKDGDVGATEFRRTGGNSIFVPAIPTRVVEAVGAGDAFAAGYLAAALEGLPPAERLQAGHERARQVLTSTSDFIVEPPAPIAEPSEPVSEPTP